MFTEEEKRRARLVSLTRLLTYLGWELKEGDDGEYQVLKYGELYVRDNQFDDRNVLDSIGFRGNAVDFYKQYIKNDYTKALQALLEFEKARKR